MEEQNTPDEKPVQEKSAGNSAAVQQGKRDLTTGGVTSTMLLFAVPMILGNVLQQCYNLADTWIVGKFVGSGALAAVGSAYTLMTFLTSIITGMCMGGGALFSICYGRRDIRKMKEYMVSSFALILGITALLTALSFTFLHPILRLMQIPSDVYDMMYDYMWIILFGLPFIFLYNYFAFLLRSVGNSVTPLVFLGVSTVLNIGLDYVFVAVFDWNVEGAAIATVLAQIISGIGIAAYSFAKETVLRLRREELRVNGGILGEIFSYSAATGVQQSVMNFGILMVQGLVNSFGTAVMAAFAAGVKIDTLAYMPAQEFGNAYSIFISQNYGAGKKDRIRKGSKSAVIVVLVFCLAASSGIPACAPAHGHLYRTGRDRDHQYRSGISPDRGSVLLRHWDFVPALRIFPRGGKAEDLSAADDHFSRDQSGSGLCLRSCLRRGSDLVGDPYRMGAGRRDRSGAYPDCGSGGSLRVKNPLRQEAVLPRLPS